MLELKHNTYLDSAASGLFDRELRIYDDMIGPLWVCGEEFGPSFVIRAQSFESAWEIWVDESSTIDDVEVSEAYGIYNSVEWDLFVACHDLERDLVEGYEYQSNMSGTGIVDVGHHAWLREVSPEECRTPEGLHIRIKSDPL